MKSRLARFGAFAMAFAFVTTLAVAGAVDNPDIETIMKKVNGGKGLQKALGKDLQASTINWEDAGKKSKEIQELVDSLGKNEPPKGDKKSWEKLTKDYAANAKALNEACEKKDKSAAGAALGKMSRSCKSCHDAHKG
jgi:cytochrome c'